MRGEHGARPDRRASAQAAIVLFFAMIKDQVKKILDRVLTWPPERQADLAHIAELMEEQDNSRLRLTEEQAEEVRRRLADPDPKTLTLAEFNERLKRRYGV